MTDNELIEYYSNLLIIQYAGKPRAKAMVEAFAFEVVSEQVGNAVKAGFCVDDAIGVQLDVLGSYAGVSRYGVNLSGYVELDDDDFRTVILIAIFLNSSDGTLYSIQEWIAEFFQAQLLVFDFQSMRMGYYVDSSLGSTELVEFIVLQELLPRPMGVTLSPTIYRNDINSLYGFRTYDTETPNNSPMNSYSSYQTDRPWLSYEDAIII